MPMKFYIYKNVDKVLSKWQFIGTIICLPDAETWPIPCSADYAASPEFYGFKPQFR